MNARVFHALGDPTRLLIVDRLARQGEQTIGQLTGGFDMTRQAAAKHVKVLRECGLINVRENGRQSVCSLQVERLRQAEDWIASLSLQWDERLDRLRAHLEGK